MELKTELVSYHITQDSTGEQMICINIFDIMDPEGTVFPDIIVLVEEIKEVKIW